jgi:hypothetical protein
MRKLLFLAQAVALAAALTAAGGYAAWAAKRAAGHAHTCGQYKYWHNGKCMDARDKASSLGLTRLI